MRFEGETVWLTQQHMTELFQTTKQNVSLHIQNIYEERELVRGATVKESLTVQLKGNRSVQRMVEFYNLDVIISVGCRLSFAPSSGHRFREGYRTPAKAAEVEENQPPEAMSEGAQPQSSIILYQTEDGQRTEHFPNCCFSLNPSAFSLIDLPGGG